MPGLQVDKGNHTLTGVPMAGQERNWDLALCFLICTTQLVSTDSKFSEKS